MTWHENRRLHLLIVCVDGELVCQLTVSIYPIAIFKTYCVGCVNLYERKRERDSRLAKLRASNGLILILLTVLLIS